MKTKKKKPVKTIKQRIPKALREQLWFKYNKFKFKAKCPVSWCTKKITCFNLHAGHEIPESKGGPTTIKNMKPICANCNLSMGNRYTITEFSNKFKLMLNMFFSFYF